MARCATIWRRGSPYPEPDLFQSKCDAILQEQRVAVADMAECCTALNIAGLRLDDREAKRIAGSLRRAGWIKAERSHGKNWWRRGPKWRPATA